MLDLSRVVLSKGAHDTIEAGGCALEWIAFLAGEKHSDHPECTSPVLAAYVRDLNDAMPDDQRQRLIPYLERLMNTRNESLDLERAKVLAWVSITVFTTTALDAVGLVDHAASLRRLDQYDWAGAERAANGAYYAKSARSVESAYYVANSACYAAQSVWSAKYAKSARSVWSANAAKSAAQSAKYAQCATTVDVWGLALSALDEALNVK